MWRRKSEIHSKLYNTVMTGNGMYAIAIYTYYFSNREIYNFYYYEVKFNERLHPRAMINDGRIIWKMIRTNDNSGNYERVCLNLPLCEGERGTKGWPMRELSTRLLVTNSLPHCEILSVEYQYQLRVSWRWEKTKLTKKV